jgi:hypothetical protein
MSLACDGGRGHLVQEVTLRCVKHGDVRVMQ